MIKTFAGVIVGCFLLFSVLYTTVLYKSFEIPVMDSIFSGFSFLPINKEAEVDVNSDLPTEPQNITDYERTYVTVPDFKVHTYDSIKTNEVFNRNFVIEYKFQASKEYEKNTVISQTLTAGESVLSGTKITITISEGVAQIELVDVIGMPYQAAKEKLEIAGFTVKQDLRKNDGNQTEGEVFLMSKVAGLEFDEGTEIVLSVWDEVEETTQEDSTDNKSSTEKKETTTKKNEE
jgi:beta-lactam-binding protein with PASTA domain